MPLARSPSHPRCARLGPATAGAREAGEVVRHAELGPDEAAFIQVQRSFYPATVSEAGWPYVQHRGGAPGFLNVLDERDARIAQLEAELERKQASPLLD